ncbi:MAG: TadE/TadG family type IV pilus assembly protein [Methylococcaceae bacterium]
MKRSVIQKGAAMVEFAIVLPLFIVLVFGIIEFSLMLFDQAVITNASREAARSAIAFRNPKLTIAQIKDVAINYCSTHLISFGAGAIPSVDILPKPSPLTDPITNTAGASITTTVTYPYNFLVFSGLTGGLIDNPKTLSATTVMNNE